MSVIAVDNLTKGYGQERVCCGCSFNIKEAEILNVSESTATRHLSNLVKKNVLRMEGGSNDIKYLLIT